MAGAPGVGGGWHRTGALNMPLEEDLQISMRHWHAHVKGMGTYSSKRRPAIRQLWCVTVARMHNLGSHLLRMASWVRNLSLWLD